MRLRKIIVLCLALLIATPAFAQKLPAPAIFSVEPAYRYGYFCVDYILELDGINIAGAAGNVAGDFADGGIAVRAFIGKKNSQQIPSYVSDYPQDLRLRTTDWIIPDADSNSGVATRNLSGVFVYGEICGLSGGENVKLRFAAVKVNGKLGAKTKSIKVKVPAFNPIFEEAAQAIGYGSADRPALG